MSYSQIKTELLDTALNYALEIVELNENITEELYADIGRLALELMARGRLIKNELIG